MGRITNDLFDVMNLRIRCQRFYCRVELVNSVSGPLMRMNVLLTLIIFL